ncbi:MAG TPA: hypothetical protein DCP28_24250 [Cytophagales bacterium]|nr:hypothetical protein [Cytophagales bacterium]
MPLRNGYLSRLALWGLCLFGLVSARASRAQPLPLGAWRTHFTHFNATSVFLAGDRVYAGTSNSLFYREDNQLVSLSKGASLNDAHVTAGAYQSATGLTFIGYENGNIDWFDDEELVNFPPIKNASRTGDKAIYDLFFQGDTVYILSGVGAILLNPTTERVLESWIQLGPDAADAAVYAGAIVGDSIWLATEFGLIRNSLDFFVNRQDWSTWQRFNLPDQPRNTPVQQLASTASSLYAASGNNQLYRLEGQNWILDRSFPTVIQATRTGANGSLLICTSDTLYVKSASGDWSALTGESWSNLEDARQDASGTFWLADFEAGLVWGDGTTWQFGFPPGPTTDRVSEFAGIGAQMAAVPGAYANGNSQQLPGQLLMWSGTEWLTAQNEIHPSDWATVTASPFGDSVVVGAFPTGLITLPADLENSRSTVASDELFQTDILPLGIADVAYDLSGNLYVVQHRSSTPLYRRSTDGVWTTFSIDHPSAQFLEQIQPSVYGYLFLTIADYAGGGMLVYNPDSGSVLELTSSIHDLPGNTIHSLAEDQDAFLWVCGNDGVAVFTNPSSAFEPGFTAERPRIEFQEAFLGTQVYDIAFDGGNRAWLATEQGAWRLDGLGGDNALQFTSENSPFPSDVVVRVGHVPTTGEVFFNTTNGTVSYQGDAPLGEARHTTIKLFPNPVEPSFTGRVAIQGLPRQAYLRVTDLAGNRVQDLRAEGNTATWDLTDLSGNRVPAGVYLLVSSSVDGEESVVSRVVVKE